MIAMKSEQSLLESLYLQANEYFEAGEKPCNTLGSREDKSLKVVLDLHETRRSVPAVLATLLLKKIHMPEQNIRMHQKNMEGGFSGRTLDENVVTPFLKERSFPATSQSGWLTRSLEQNRPYDDDYPGKISPPRLKSAFLRLVDAAELGGCKKARQLLLLLLYGFIEARDKTTDLVLSRPVHLTISDVIRCLQAHFDMKVVGAARLPVLALHAILTVLASETERYRGCEVLALESHTAADARSRMIGDVNIVDAERRLFEGYEIKHGIQISESLIQDSFKKLQTTPVDRFYILTTYPHEDYAEFDDIIRRVGQIHGCQLIVNGVLPTLKYYLRLIGSTRSFIDAYVSHLEKDSVISYQIKEKWNRIVESR